MMIMQSDFYIIQHGLVFKKADILKGSCNSGFINIYGFLSGNIFSSNIAILLYLLRFLCK